MFSIVEININASNTMVDLPGFLPANKCEFKNYDDLRSAEAIRSIPQLIHSNMVKDFTSTIIGGTSRDDNIVSLTKYTPNSFNSGDVCYSSSSKSLDLPTRIERSPLLKDSFGHKQSFDNKNDSLYSRASDEVSNEEVVKVTNASSLDLTCILHMTPPQINNYPDIVRIPSQIKCQSEYNPCHYSDTVYNSAPLMYEHNMMRILSQNDLTLNSNNSHGVDDWTNNSGKKFSSKGVQTIPVQIFPMSNEVKIVRMVASEYKKGDAPETKSNKKSMKKQEKNKKRNIQQGQPGPSVMKSEIVTHSDFKPRSKCKENVNTKVDLSPIPIKGDIDDNDTIEELWGDVYNDYKQLSSEHVDERTILNPDTNKLQIKTSSKVLLDLNKKIVDSSSPKKDNNQILQSPKSNIKKESSIFLKIPDPNFQKIFELSPFDELVKSYLTPSDRRIRSVCSKIGCKIKLYDPPGTIQLETPKKSQSPRIKNLYYIVISAETKERLDKSIKCIQETFPKTFLNEKLNNTTFFENCGDAIPL